MPEHCPKTPANSRVPGRWVDAGYLQVGDRVFLKKGSSAAIVDIKLRAAEQKVYNIMVEDLYSYAVGGNQTLVHNNSVFLENPNGLDADDAKTTLQDLENALSGIASNNAAMAQAKNISSAI